MNCKKREEEKTVTYWRIINEPDLTEGRGHYGSIYVKVKVPQYTDPKLMLEDYCYRTFGRPVAFVQGCAPISNWSIHEIDRVKWLEGGEIRVGDYSYKSAKLELKMGAREEGLTA